MELLWRLNKASIELNRAKDQGIGKAREHLHKLG